MSQARQRDNSTPSLFPFLAVLLCTMGALVLLLVLIVSKAQASAKKMVTERQQEIEETETQIDMARDKLASQLEKGRLDIESKRLALQGLEKQIRDLTDELDGLRRTAELLDQDVNTTEQQKRESAERATELEKQLAEASEKLKNKEIEKPTGNKPIFAIIPYEGTNGTHRRPVYLECVESGVIIQPEGVRLTLKDLAPPYGPGNPLDASIRTIRSRYASENSSLTSSAYPLLVVRPSGVRSYAMARQAIASWDDQFGYELIDETMELAFPEGEPGLAEEIEQSITVARQRQAALILAMPGKYRQFVQRQSDIDADSNMGWNEDGDQPGDGSGFAAGESGGTGSGLAYGGGPSGTASAGGRGGFATGTGQGGYSVGSASVSDGSAVGFGASGDVANRQLGDGAAGGYFGSSMGGQGNSGSMVNGNTFGQGGVANGAQFGVGNGLASNNGNGGQRPGDAGNSGTQVNNNTGSGFQSNGNSSGGGGYGGAGGNAGPGGPSSGGNGSPGSPGNGGAGNVIGRSQSLQSDTMAANDIGSDPTQGFQLQKSVGPDRNSGSQTGGSESASNGYGQSSSGSEMGVNNPFGSKSSRKTESIARRRGRGWAWTEGPPTKKAFVRAIRVTCYADRLVVMPDRGNKQETTIPFASDPQVSAEKLANTIRERVSDWGIAFADGYWKPELLVEVAPDAEERYRQLSQMFEGSGLELRRRNPTR